MILKPVGAEVGESCTVRPGRVPNGVTLSMVDVGSTPQAAVS